MNTMERTLTPARGPVMMLEPAMLRRVDKVEGDAVRNRPAELARMAARGGAIMQGRDARMQFADLGGGASPLVISMGKVAVVMIDGCMWHDESMCWWYGGVSHDEIKHALRTARMDPASDTVVLMFNSGGGSHAGMGELLAEARALAEEKTVIALARECMCSAAYWLATTAERIVATSTAMVGSIGTMLMEDLYDDTKMLAEAGLVRVKMQWPGRMKNPNPGPLDEGIVKAWLDNLESTFAPFRADVAASRTLTPQQVDAMEGHWFTAQLAQQRGLVDEIVTDAGAWLAGIGVSVVPDIGAEGDDGETGNVGAEDGCEPKKESDMDKPNGVPADALKSVDLAGIKNQRPDLVAALKSELRAELTQQLEQEPAEAVALKEICGEDADMFQQAVLGKWSVSRARDEALSRTRASLAASQQRVKELTAVKAKGGGGGVEPVAINPKAESATDFLGLVSAEMEANPKISFDKACANVACNPKYAVAHRAWISAGCPES